MKQMQGNPESRLLFCLLCLDHYTHDTLLCTTVHKNAKSAAGFHATSTRQGYYENLSAALCHILITVTIINVTN